MFSYLILKVLFNIYQSLDIHDEKAATLDLPHRLDRGKRLWKPFSKCGPGIYLLCVYPKFTSKISLVISSHDWFTLGSIAADKNCILTRSKVISRKALNG